MKDDQKAIHSALLGAIFGRNLPTTTTPGNNAFALQSLNDAIRDVLDAAPGEQKILGIAVHVLVEDEAGERDMITLESEPGLLDVVEESAAAAEAAIGALYSIGGAR